MGVVGSEVVHGEGRAADSRKGRIGPRQPKSMDDTDPAIAAEREQVLASI